MRKNVKKQTHLGIFTMSARTDIDTDKSEMLKAVLPSLIAQWFFYNPTIRFKVF